MTFLALHAGEPVPRERLAALLWGDRFDGQARQSLRECLSRLRRALGDRAASVLLADRDSVSLNAEHIDVDVLRFEQLVESDNPEALVQATEFYTGDLVDGFATREAAFDDWLDVERARLLALACTGLGRLAAHQEAEQGFEAALNTAQRLVALDPFHEAGHRMIMRAHARGGRQNAALRHYRTVADLLRQELDVETEVETRRLAEEIRGSRTAPDATPVSASEPKGSPSRGKKLKMMVLPFASMSDGEEQDYFVNGINEDIVTALTRYRWLSVMGHNTTMALKNRRAEMLNAAREFGICYVVDGSVRKAGHRMRVSTQLIDVESGEHIWAERYDRDLDDLFEVQDDIAKTITATIEPELAANEGRYASVKPTESLDAWDSYHIGLLHMYKFTKADNDKAQEMFQRAVEIDLDFAVAYARLSYAKVMSIVYFEAEVTSEILDDALALAERAIQLDELDAVAQFALGRAHLIRGEYFQSVAAFETALDLNPCLAHSHCGLGDTIAYRGDPADSISNFEEAVRLSPYDPYRWAFLMYGSMAYLFMRQHEEAARWASAASRVPNSHYWATAALVSSLGHIGSGEECGEARSKLLAQKPGFSCSFARKRLFYIRDQAQLDHYVAGLEKAGIPD